MSEKIMMDGEPLEAGDRVWCLVNGWLVLNHFIDFKENCKYPLVFIDENGVYRTYTRRLQNTVGTSRTLYWDEIKITPPPKPKKKVKVWDWFVQWEFQGSTRIDKLCATTEGLVRKTYTGAECIIQKIDGTEREVER